MNQGLESLPMSENADRVVMLGDGIAQRMYPTKDGKITCDPICGIHAYHCSPALGGGCCPNHLPVCCANGAHCRRYGPC